MSFKSIVNGLADDNDGQCSFCHYVTVELK